MIIDAELEFTDADGESLAGVGSTAGFRFAPNKIDLGADSAAVAIAGSLYAAPGQTTIGRHIFNGTPLWLNIYCSESFVSAGETEIDLYLMSYDALDVYYSVHIELRHGKVWPLVGGEPTDTALHLRGGSLTQWAFNDGGVASDANSEWPVPIHRYLKFAWKRTATVSAGKLRAWLGFTRFTNQSAGYLRRTGMNFL